MQGFATVCRSSVWWVMIMLLVWMVPGGCSDKGSQNAIVKTQPSEKPGPTSQAPSPRPSAGPAEQPLQQPASAASEPATSRPASSYDSKPPYPVSLYVTSPSEEQPGWLRIEGLQDDKHPGTLAGRFPEQNRIYVESGNVQRLRIHVGHLPLAPNQRVILQIDGQGMVLSRKEPFATLERMGTGEWVVVKKK